MYMYNVPFIKKVKKWKVIDLLRWKQCLNKCFKVSTYLKLCINCCEYITQNEIFCEV